MDKISVIVPIYNSEKYLKQCIESILSQTYRNFELILISDGSKDESVSICKKYQQEDDRIKILELEHKGVSNARNQGINVATGDFICFIDSDDEVDKNYLQMLILLQNKYNADIVEADIQYMNAKQIKNIDDQEEVVTPRQMMSRLYSKNGVRTVIITNKLYKKEIFEKIRFDTERENEDEFIAHRLIFEVKNKIVVSNQKLYFYRIHKNSRQRTFNKKKLELLEVFDEREKYFPQDKELIIKNRMAKIDMILLLYSVCKINKQKEEQEYLKNIFEQEYNNIDFKLNIKRKIKYFGFYIMPNIVSDFIILKRGNVI